MVIHKLDENTPKNSITLASHLQATGKSLLMSSTDFDIFVVTLFTWSLKVIFPSSVLTVKTFVKIESQTVMLLNEFFWLAIIYEILLTLRESRLT